MTGGGAADGSIARHRSRRSDWPDGRWYMGDHLCDSQRMEEAEMTMTRLEELLVFLGAFVALVIVTAIHIRIRDMEDDENV